MQLPPATIPILKTWHSSEGIYIYGSETRIVLSNIPDAETEQFEKRATLFAAELHRVTGHHPSVVSHQEPQTGDICLNIRREAKHSLADEGYQLIVGAWATINAPTMRGLFYGTRTLLQMLKQSRSLPCGMAQDRPDYPERGLMLDLGRKYLSVGHLENIIRELAYLKYNLLHLHLSDSPGFRLESERHPEIVAEQHYTKAEIRSFIALAQDYHITIVPEIDMPGHMNAILATRPHLGLDPAVGSQPHVGAGYFLDLGNEEAFTLMRDLLEEYLPLFPGPYWHLGADEYVYPWEFVKYPSLVAASRRYCGPDAHPRDIFYYFLNWANDIVKAHGKTMRVWSDTLDRDGTIHADTDIIREHWKYGLSAREVVDLGHRIMNCNLDMLYYTPPEHYSDSRAIYEAFEPHHFQDGTIEPHHPLNLGAKLHFWGDHAAKLGLSEQAVVAGLHEPLRALAQKVWGGGNVGAYEAFQEIVERVGSSFPIDE